MDVEMTDVNNINPVRRGPKPKYPFRKMTKVGHSFFLPGRAPSSFSSLMNYYNNRVFDDDRKFQMEVAEKDGVKGLRITRTQ